MSDTYDIYAIEASPWPWVSRRRAGDALREMQARHESQLFSLISYAERVRERQCEKIAALEFQILELERK